MTYQEKVADVTTKLQQKHAYRPGLGDSGAARLALQPLESDKTELQTNPFDKGSESRRSLRIHLAQVDIELEQMTETTNLLENSLTKVKARLHVRSSERTVSRDVATPCMIISAISKTNWSKRGPEPHASIA